MVSVIASIILAISVLVATLVAFSPNARAVVEKDFLRTAKSNAYIYGWEWGQLNVRTNNLPSGDTITTPSHTLTQKGNTVQQTFSDSITYTIGIANPLTIVVATPFPAQVAAEAAAAKAKKDAEKKAEEEGIF